MKPVTITIKQYFTNINFYKETYLITIVTHIKTSKGKTRHESAVQSITKYEGGRRAWVVFADGNKGSYDLTTLLKLYQRES